jgi:hypothetical protein
MRVGFNCFDVVSAPCFIAAFNSGNDSNALPVEWAG